MGLAEPRKRQKLSHDPRNLAWSSQSSETSYGHRLMTQQGWSQGQALGKRTTTSRFGVPSDAERLASAHVGVLFKDDNLGLGARRKGGKEAVENQKVGLDAFQGLLGRLNGKSEEVLKQEEKKVADRKLAMYARGRWGGMIFVKGGVLVGTLDKKEQFENTESATLVENDQPPPQLSSRDQEEAKRKEREERRKLKEEKRQRKEARRIRREEKARRRAAKKAKDDAQGLTVHKSPLTQPPDEPVSSAVSDNESEAGQRSGKRDERRKHKSSKDIADATEKKSPVSSLKAVSNKPSVTVMQTGRHLLRGRNIQAKKMVLADMKGLDEIFMR
ncbi:hypothetical protein AYO20_08845 [Fonsecaea nubica]|uniref:G-patch domain-containing protein n=1 Tax=Fonsecaea nubica TaxID=856822 RepID=A0A178CN72_9EURO|nr:hypothetical protein AYO20_08845 [Fonsecaea nubica]OAL30271.1 hypothetical protein AYO20_08845 [Fonsecaea nubica]